MAMKTFDELTKKEQLYWNEKAKNLKPFEELFIMLSKMKKCIWCGQKFSGGIIRKWPGKEIPLSSYTWFTPKFLVHAKTTHGFDPETIDAFLEKYK